jgi:paraquat-inducible protein B
VTKQRWPFPLVWIVPILAALAVAWYVWGIYKERGPEIAISFADAGGLKLKDTPLTFHGVRIGTISGMTLDADRQRAVVKVQVNREFEKDIARNGSRFWIVRPDIGGGMITGLSTVISGPYIEVAPGAGDPLYTFNGLDAKPVMLGDGVRVILTTDRLAHLQIDSPVYFRGIQVGAIQDIRFTEDARGVNITAFIWKRYARLVHPASQFWAVTGTDIRGGVFSGISVEVNNIKALFAGGVAFATPDDNAPPASDGERFVLHDEGKADWLKWSAPIQLPLDDNPGMPAPESPGEVTKPMTDKR